MPTSGTITSSKTAGQFVTEAFQEIRVYGKGRTPDAQDMAAGLTKLNDMLKEWQHDGVNLWRETDMDISWPADTADGVLTPRVHDILELRHVLSTTHHRPLARWERAEYSRLPNKAASGNPSIFSFVREVGSARLLLWPVPTDDIDLKATVSRVIEDVTDAAETLDVPQEWASTVMYNLAARLANPNGRADQNIASVMNQADSLYRRLRAFDRPASYIMEAG